MRPWLAGATSSMLHLALHSAVATAAPTEPTGREPSAPEHETAPEGSLTPEPASAARAHAAAFDALSTDERIGLEGEYEINLAVDQYKLAQELLPGELAYLEEEAALLERFERLRTEAHEEGLGEGMPPGLAQELARVRAEIDGFRRVQEEATRAARAEAARQAAQLAQEVAVAQERMQAQVEDQPRPVLPAPQRRRLSRRTTDAAILGSGLVAALGGAALVGSGIWTLRTAIDRRDEQLEALAIGDYEDEAGSEERLRQWYASGRNVAAGLLAAGTGLAGAGIGLSAWASARSADDEGARPRSRSQVAGDAAVLASGLAAIVGGAAVISGGAQALRTVDTRYDAQSQALELDSYPDEQRLRAELDQWFEQRRSRAVGMMAGGAVLLGAGAGLTIWGVVRARGRLRVRSPRAHLIGPMLSARRLGIVASGAF